MKSIIAILPLAALLGLAEPISADELDALIQHCNSCHGPDGVSQDSNVPTIAGQPKALIANAHEQFKDWARPCTELASEQSDQASMCSVSESLDSNTINQLAGYFAGRTFRAARQTFDDDLAVQGAQLHQMYCESCHTHGGSAADYAGHLAGQWTPYLRRSVAQIRQQEMQVPSVMEHKMSQFTASDIEALLNFWASQQD